MTVVLRDPDVTLHHGDVLEVLAGMPDGSVDCCVTSPPYWGLRDYGTPGQIGLEPTVDEFVQKIVAVFREVRRVLADHGTCWINLGDSYAGGHGGSNTEGRGSTIRKANRNAADPRNRDDVDVASWSSRDVTPNNVIPGMKPKDLVGVPWRVALALQADGWWLRSDIIWAKPNPMPESCRDRPTSSYEHVFLLTARPRYWFDAEAVREVSLTNDPRRPYTSNGAKALDGRDEWHGGERRNGEDFSSRNVRDVWTIATQPYPDAHFATFPTELARRCIVAGCPQQVCRVCGAPRERIVETDGERWRERVANGEPPRHGPSGVKPSYSVGSNGRIVVGWSDCGHNNYRPGIVLDPFMGSGTVAYVARNQQRHAVGIDLSGEYLKLAARRLAQLSLLAEATA